MNFDKSQSSSKIAQYKRLIAERMECKKCLELINMYELDNKNDIFDGLPDEIGPWSRWQGNLNADLMIVAQDWGSQMTYIGQKGWDTSVPYRSITNRNIIELMKSIGLGLLPPEDHDQPQKYFFTNAVLCLRRAEKEQGGAKPSWFRNCGYYLRKQIEIVRPKAVVALGKDPFDSVINAFEMEFSYPSDGYENLVNSRTAVEILSDTYLIPVFHCGAFGVNVNRKSSDPMDKLKVHKNDWKTIREYLQRR